MTALRIVPDPDNHGIHDPLSPYASSVWLPVLGPTGFLLWSRLSSVARNAGTVGPDQLCADLGLGRADGNQSALARTLRRLEVFHIARPSGEATLLVCTDLDWVPDRYLRRLHPAVVQRHRRFVEMAATRTTPPVALASRAHPDSGTEPA